MSLRALVCDPEKSTRNRLCDFLSRMPIVEHSTGVDSVAELLEVLAADQINILFIDPHASGLDVTSKMIFRIRQNFPRVILCLLIQPGEVRRRAAEFYAGERERFGHYFKLNKELPDACFEEEAYLMIFHCHEAVRKLRLRSGRIQLTMHPRFMDGVSRAGRNTSVEQQFAREKPSPMGMHKPPLPAGGFLSSLPGFKNLAGLFTRP